MNTPFGNCPPRPELDELIKKSIAWFESLSPAEQAAHRQAQRESWVRGEMGWPKPKFTWELRNGELTKVYASYADYCNG